MPRRDPITFRPRDAAQLRRLELLSFYLNLSASETMRRAVDELYERHAAEIATVAEQYDAAQSALDAARQAAAELRGK